MLEALAIPFGGSRAKDTVYLRSNAKTRLTYFGSGSGEKDDGWMVLKKMLEWHAMVVGLSPVVVWDG